MNTCCVPRLGRSTATSPSSPSFKEAKYKGGSTLCQKFADAWDYCDYLREAHADAFATACMLLRCENKKEFRRECRRSYIRSGMTFYQASRDPDREYPSLRFYMSFPIEKEIIRQMKRYRRSGEDRQFFLPDGKIDMKKLADAVDEAVMKNAFSPRVFQQILDDDRKGRCGIHEKSWRQPLGEARWCRFLSILDLDGETKALQRKVDAHTRRNEERTAVSFERLKSADSSAVLLNIACGLDDKSISLTEIMRFFKINPNSYAELDVMTALAAGRLPDAAVRTAKAKILKQKPHCGAFMAEMLENLAILISDCNPHGKNSFRSCLPLCSRYVLTFPLRRSADAFRSLTGIPPLFYLVMQIKKTAFTH